MALRSSKILKLDSQTKHYSLLSDRKYFRKGRWKFKYLKGVYYMNGKMRKTYFVRLNAQQDVQCTFQLLCWLRRISPSFLQLPSSATKIHMLNMNCRINEPCSLDGLNQHEFALCIHHSLQKGLKSLFKHSLTGTLV